MMPDWMIVIAAAVVVVLFVFIIGISTKKKEEIPTFSTTKQLFDENLHIDELPQCDVEDVSLDKDQFRAFNPSVSLVNDDMLYSFRVSNYVGCDKNSGKPVRDPNVIIGDKVKNYIMLSNMNDDIININIPDHAHPKCVTGFEDARLIVTPDNKNVLLIANSHSNANCYTEMHLITIPYEDIVKTFESSSKPKVLNVDDSQVLRLYLEDHFKPSNNEKNWMPFFDGNDLMFVYSINPHIILKCDMSTGECKKVSETLNHKVNSSLRGSSQARLYQDQYVAIAHWRLSTSSYVTQAYTFEKETPYKITAISPPFVINDQANRAETLVQFVSGFEIYNDTAYITYGEKDCDSKLFKVSMSSLLSSMKKV